VAVVAAQFHGVARLAQAVRVAVEMVTAHLAALALRVLQTWAAVAVAARLVVAMAALAVLA
jgi:hypothetical protein